MAIIRTGMLNKQFTLQKPVVTRGDLGSETVTYTTEATVWGHLRYTSGRENIDTGRVAADSEAIITIRHRRKITADWRLKYGSRIFQIIAPPEDPELRHEWTVLKCREVEGG